MPTEEGPHLSLGQLLIKKAREGVRVCLLIWDDRTSLNNPLIFRSGLMMTHDEDTRRYFRGTGVRTPLRLVADLVGPSIELKHRSMCSLVISHMILCLHSATQL